MQIDNFKISRYGKLKDFSTGFAPGLNLIKGPNEAGKSTLVEALIDALFENPKSRKKDIQDKKSWGFDKDFEITLEFESEGLSYSLSKDFDSGTVSLVKGSSGETLDDRKRVDSILAESLGLSNREVFLATSCIRQDEMARISSSPDAIRDRLESLITGGKEDTLASKAIEKIEAQIKEIKKHGHKYPGVLQKLEADREHIVYELDKAKRDIETTAQNRTRLKEVKNNLARLTEELKVKSSQREKAKKALNAREHLKELEDKFGDLSTRVNNIKEAKKNVESLRKKLSELPEIDKADVTRASEQSAQMRYLESKKESAEEDVEEAEQEVQNTTPGMAVKLLSILSILGSGGAAAYWYFMTQMTEIPFLIGAGVGLALFVLFLVLWTSKSKTLKGAEARLAAKETHLKEINDDMYANESATKTLLAKYHIMNINALKEKYEARTECEKDIRNETNRYDAYLADRNLNELEDELKQTTRDLAVEQERFGDLKAYETDPGELAKLDTFVETAELGIKKLQSEETTLEKQLDFSESGIEHQRSLEERLEYIDKQLKRTKHKLDVYEMTCSFIEKSRKDVLKSTLKLLEDETSQILSEVTNGRYSKVRFDRQTLKYDVFSEEFGDWIEPEKYLSRGTTDQLFLAARLALVKIISEERNPVIILDDPFVTFDENRRQSALDVLKRFANRYQIFLLTCHSEYDNITESVISLG